jgi:hypothetical protein
MVIQRRHEAGPSPSRKLLRWYAIPSDSPGVKHRFLEALLEQRGHRVCSGVNLRKVKNIPMQR